MKLTSLEKEILTIVITKILDDSTYDKEIGLYCTSTDLILSHDKTDHLALKNILKKISGGVL